VFFRRVFLLWFFHDFWRFFFTKTHSDFGHFLSWFSIVLTHKEVCISSEETNLRRNLSNGLRYANPALRTRMFSLRPRYSTWCFTLATHTSRRRQNIYSRQKYNTRICYKCLCSSRKWWQLYTTMIRADPTALSVYHYFSIRKSLRKRITIWKF